LFGDDPTWTDVEQGNAGTCYILAAMQALSEWPDLVKNVFKVDEVNTAGIYAV
jgi:hypothetical protein